MRKTILAIAIAALMGSLVAPAMAQVTTPAPAGNPTCKEGEKYDPVIKACTKSGPR